MKDYVMPRIFKASTGIAQGIFVTLGIGLLIKNIGTSFEIDSLVQIGTIAISLMAPAVGAGVALMLGANALVIFSAMIAAAVGAGALSITEAGVLIKAGEPIGALLTATIATFVGKRISGKTPLDMMVIPLGTILIAGFAGLWLSTVIAPILTTVGGLIKTSTAGNPLLSSIILAMVWGLFLISPASSVALAMALDLSGIAGGAALAGCAAHFIGFSIISWKENQLGGILAQGMCTPKVQLPNITKNPYILVPTLIASAIVGPISALVFKIEAGKEIAGMGLSSFVAPLQLLTSYDLGFILPAMLITYILVPAAISYGIYLMLKKFGKIKENDLRLPN
ncbi:PTS transporter subunit IIC [Mesobacillus selenatarsenatis]|uniref:Membrane protein n=1 Tax=Mesobacillus selenatarsenatis (strain DSM 18680 / JCM 14380 / FERM P-15431 / SF-1) TaxID=1321606 RepID=A0A0A8XBD7_MESS1|nr:PTS sugar transporter subunit IIC [Mesobacillus selenatarsenatis]GAM15451.1 membrane protein [Mesobacillus selenatarsenatis SF-1]